MKKFLIILSGLIVIIPATSFAFTVNDVTVNSICDLILENVTRTDHSLGYNFWDENGDFVNEANAAIFSADDSGIGNEPQMSALPIGFCVNQDPDKNFANPNNRVNLGPGTYTLTESDYYEDTGCDGSQSLSACLASPFTYGSKTIKIRASAENTQGAWPLAFFMSFFFLFTVVFISWSLSWF